MLIEANYFWQMVTKNVYSFKNFKTLKKLIKELFNRNMTLKKKKKKQNKLAEKHDKLRPYPTKRV